MGLLEKALTDLEAGRPVKGAGLFAKALTARSSREEAPPEAARKAAQPIRKAAEAIAAPAAVNAPPAIQLQVPGPAPETKREPGPAPSAATERERPVEPAAGRAVPVAPETEPVPEPEARRQPEPAGVSEPVTEAESEPGPEPAPGAFPFSPAEVEELAGEIRALDPSEDGAFAAYARISEALPLEGLALLSVGKVASVLCAPPSFMLPHVSRLDLDASALQGAGGGAPLPESLRKAIPFTAAQGRAGTLRASQVQGRTPAPLALWLYSDSRIDGNEALVAALDGLFSSAPAPSAEPADFEAISPGLAALRLPLGAGKATVLRYDLPAFLDRCEKLLDGLRKDALVGSLIHGLQAMMAAEGKIFYLDGNKLVSVFFSKESADSELIMIQFGKSLKRAFPFLSAANFPEGKSLALDLASSSALEAFERFIAN